jgi:hypothetical protein
MSEIVRCTDCLGEGSVECPECWGAGRVKCEGCNGEGIRAPDGKGLQEANLLLDTLKTIAIHLYNARLSNPQMKGTQTDAP